jgi:hypothetical protein
MDSVRTAPRTKKVPQPLESRSNNRIRTRERRCFTNHPVTESLHLPAWSGSPSRLLTLFWEDVFEPYGAGPRFPIVVVQAIFNVFPFHFLKHRPPRLRECLKERPSLRFTKDHGPAIVGISDSSLIRRFFARFAGFHFFADIKTVYLQCSIQYIQYYYL